MSLSRAEIIRTKPIGGGLDKFRDSFKSTCQDLGLPDSSSALRQLENEVIQNLALDLVSAFRALPALRVLPSVSGRKNLFSDLLRLNSAISSDDFNVEQLVPLLTVVLNNEPDEVIWDHVYNAVTEHTPPPRSLPFLGQTPYLHNTSSFVNSSEHRKYVDAVLKEELGSLFIGVPDFYKAFFGDIENLEEAGIAVFQRCKEEDSPIYSDEAGWRDWPEHATQNEVLQWLTSQVNLFRDLAEEQGFTTNTDRRIWARPNQPLQGSTAERKLDVGFISGQDTDGSNHHWSHILVPGELKSNPDLDTSSRTWLDLGRYVREMFAAQDSRRFIVGFTLCGSIMRLWEFDRAGGIASLPFDINKDGQQFVSVVLGCLWMNDEQLGFDPTIRSSEGKRFIEIVRDGHPERLILDGLMKRAPCVAGRATTCWKAHREGDESKTPLVIKDSWQYPARGEEGLLLREATEKGVVNMARYYHHETVRIGDKVDDICDNVRKGLDMAKATNFRHSVSDVSQRASEAGDAVRKGRTTDISSVGRKRSSSRADAPLPPSKRTCSSSPTKGGRGHIIQNRVHRRVIICDYGKPIYRASSRVAMLVALEDCIEGYESLHMKAGMLQGDISTGNLMMGENGRGFLIDLDLAIKEQREQPSGARGKTGTRAFMAIGLLFEEKHSFMHDLESFFWVLFWICIHYNGPNEGSRVVAEFDKWNYVTMKELAKLKLGTVSDEDIFNSTAQENFTPYYEPLIPWVNRMRKVVFPNGGPWKVEDKGIYARIKAIFRDARRDPRILER